MDWWPEGRFGCPKGRPPVRPQPEGGGLPRRGGGQAGRQAGRPAGRQAGRQAGGRAAAAVIEQASLKERITAAGWRLKIHAPFTTASSYELLMSIILCRQQILFSTVVAFCKCCAPHIPPLRIAPPCSRANSSAHNLALTLSVPQQMRLASSATHGWPIPPPPPVQAARISFSVDGDGPSKSASLSN